MITPLFGLSATERVLPKLALDFTTASLDPRITFSRASTATRVNSAGLIETVATNAPRFDYDPVTKQPKGLLIEEQRTNLLKYSQDYTQTWWFRARGTLTANAAVAPDGTSTANLLAASATGLYYGCVFKPNMAYTSNTYYTLSVYAKSSVGQYLIILLNEIGEEGCANFDLTNGVVGTVSNGATASMTSVGNGWYRCVVSSMLTATSTGILVFGVVDSNTTTSVTSGNSIYLWGAQLETGAFATSYIPTTTTALTRNADVATMTGTNFSDWFNANEGTFVGSAIAGQSDAGFLLATLQTPYNGNELTGFERALVSGTSRISFNLNANGQFLALGDNVANNAPKNTLVTISGGYKTADCQAYVNATNTESSSVAVTMPASQVRLMIGSFVNNKYWNGWVQKIKYYPQKLTLAELQATSK